MVQFLFEVKYSSFLPSTQIVCTAFKALAFEEHRGGGEVNWKKASAEETAGFTGLRCWATKRKVPG